MRVRSLLIATAILVVVANGNYAGRSSAKDADCLSPVDPYRGDWHVRYTDQLRRRLEPPLRTFAQMLVMPAFEGECSVPPRRIARFGVCAGEQVFPQLLRRREEHLVFDAGKQ